MMTLDTALLILAGIALVVGLGAFRHSRANRRALIRLLQHKPDQARRLLIAAGVSENEFY